MITVETTYTLAGGTAPYNIVVTSPNTCATISYASPVGNTFLVTVTAASSDCFPVTLNITGTDSQGCLITLPSEVVASPCDDLTIQPITIIDNGTDDIVFRAVASSPPCPSLTFNWIYNDVLFEQVGVTNGSFSSTLQLRTRDGASFPANTLVSVNVTDCKGCTANSTFSYVLCTPNAFDFPLTLFCLDTQFSSPTFSFPSPTSSCEFEIDWTTLEINLPSGWILQTVTPGTYRIVAPLSTPSGTYVGYWSVETTEGIRTDLGVITITVASCGDTNTIFISGLDFHLDCDSLAEDIIEIPAESLVVTSPGTIIDWSTWTLVTPPTPVSTNITLGLDGSGQRVIRYEIPDPLVSDIFSWTVCDTVGNCATSAIITTVECMEAPVAVDDEACVSCADSTTIDVLANDTSSGGPLVISSIIIVTPPTNGTAFVSMGQIIYTPSNTFSGTDSLQYTVQNATGLTSNVATVDIEVLCAGEGGSIIVCS